MLYISTFDDEYLERAIASDDFRELLSDALQCFEREDPGTGHNVCQDLQDQSSVAVLLSALFSKEGEQEDEFEARHVSDLKRAATMGNPLAQYALGVYYDNGDMVEGSRETAENYYRMSAEAKMPLACHVYGIMLYYGSGLTKADKERGFEMVRYASEQGVEDAAIFLRSLS